MKYKTRQQRNLSFKQIVKRKNKKTKKQRKLSFRQIVERKNKRTRTRKQQHGGVAEWVVGLSTLSALIGTFILFYAFGHFFYEIVDMIEYIDNNFNKITGMFNKSPKQQSYTREENRPQSGGGDEPSNEALNIIDSASNELARAIIDSNPNNGTILDIANNEIDNLNPISISSIDDDVDEFNEFDQMMHRLDIQINRILLCKSIMPEFFYKKILRRSLGKVIKDCPDSDIKNVVEMFHIFLTTYNKKDNSNEQLQKILELKNNVEKCTFVKPVAMIDELEEALKSDANPESLLITLKDITDNTDNNPEPVKKNLGSRFSRVHRFLRLPQFSTFRNFRNPFRLMKRENISNMFRNRAVTETAFKNIDNALEL